MTIVAGVVAGILGITGWQGSVVYFISQALVGTYWSVSELAAAWLVGRWVRGSLIEGGGAAWRGAWLDRWLVVCTHPAMPQARVRGDECLGE